jgi:hypothetical protein
MVAVLAMEAFGFAEWNKPKNKEEITQARKVAPLGPTLGKFSPSAMFLS